MEVQPIRSVVSHHHHQQQNSNDALITNKKLSDLAFFNSFPPGYRFQPTDEELVVYYLSKKIKNEALPRNKINDVNIYNYNPETLCDDMFKEFGENEWYFFTPRERKYRNGKRPNRAAGNGYWKATGADKSIYNSEGRKIGDKQTLDFYQGKQPNGVKTTWIMHEYKAILQEDADSPKCDKSTVNVMGLDTALCRIYQKGNRTINMKNNPNKRSSIVDEDDDEKETHKVEVDILDQVDGYSGDNVIHQDTIEAQTTFVSNYENQMNYNKFESYLSGGGNATTVHGGLMTTHNNNNSYSGNWQFQQETEYNQTRIDNYWPAQEVANTNTQTVSSIILNHCPENLQSL